MLLMSFCASAAAAVAAAADDDDDEGHYTTSRSQVGLYCCRITRQMADRLLPLVDPISPSCTQSPGHWMIVALQLTLCVKEKLQRLQ